MLTDGAKSVLLTLVVCAIASGIVGAFLTTSIGRDEIEQLRAHEAAPYEVIYGSAGRVISWLGSLVFVATFYVLTQRRRSGRPASAVTPLVVGLVLGALTWGYCLYATNRVEADEARQFAIATSLANRQDSEIMALYAAYLEAQKAAHLEGVVDLGNAGSKEAIADARQRVAALGRAVATFESDVMSAHARFQREIEALDILGSHKRTMLEGLAKVARKRESRVRAYGAAERAVITATGQIVASLAPGSATGSGAKSELGRLRDQWRAAADKEQVIASALKSAL